MRRPLALTSLGLLLLLSASAMLPQSAGAQALEPGVRVRVTQANGFRQAGTLQALDTAAAHVVAAGGAPVAIPLADVTRLEVSLGTQRQFWRNLALTAGGLTLLGGGLSAATYQPCESDALFGCLLSPESRSEAFMWGAFVGGIVGVPVGLAVGAFVRHERWAPVEHPVVPQRRLTVRPAIGRRVGLSATLVLE